MAYGYGTVVTEKDPLNVRSLPNSRATKIGSLEKGSEVTLIEERGDWWMIEYEGDEGFVSARYIQVIEYPTEDEDDYEDDYEDVSDSDQELNLYTLQQNLLTVCQDLRALADRLKELAYELG